MEAASTAVPAQLPQHMQALAHANEIRLARAALKRAINAGNETRRTLSVTAPRRLRR